MNESTLLLVLGLTAITALCALAAVLFRKGRTEDEARAYLAGVHYVLSDDPDSAIAELSKAARLNTQTYETYFALAALLRRKGELAWAIRLSQNILLKPGLNPDLRRRAQLELALDLRRSGVKDQAVEAFEKLLAEDPNNGEAIHRYREMLEETRDLKRAIELQERLVSLEKKGHEVLSHLLAERSADLREDELQESLMLAERAVALFPGSAHAQLALAQAHLARGDSARATAPLKEALTLEPELLPRHVKLLRDVLGSAEAVEAWLRQEKARRPEATPFDLALALSERERNPARAIEALRDIVERHPQEVEARRELGALLLETGKSDELRRDYIDILGTLGRPVLAFRCGACGQRLAEHDFRCRYCGAWDSVRREQPSGADVRT